MFRVLLFIFFSVINLNVSFADDVVYVVQPGDSLSAIAEKNGVSVHDLAKHNNISLTDSLFYGKKIKIPQKEVVQVNDLISNDITKNSTELNNNKLDSSSQPIVNNIKIIPRKKNNISQNGSVKQLPSTNSIDNGSEKLVPSVLIVKKPQNNITNDNKNNTIKNAIDLTKMKDLNGEQDIVSLEDINKDVNEDKSITVPDVNKVKDGYILPINSTIVANFGDNYHNQNINGMIFQSKENDKIVATNDGVVMYAGNDIKFFHFVVIMLHADGNTSVYTNLKSNVVKNQKVQKGEVIGYAGSGSEVYFSIRNKQDSVDPMTLIK